MRRSLCVTNVGKAKFIELVLDVFQLLTLEKLHYAIVRIIKQVTRQEGLASIKASFKHHLGGGYIDSIFELKSKSWYDYI